MSVEVQSKREALAARYNLPAQLEWQQFLNHFDLSENFALVVLLVADADGADLCRVELEKQLQQEGKKLVALDVPSPDALRNLPTQLLATQLPADAGGLWIAAVERDYSQNFLAWKEAWQFALARLNPRRNEIRRQFNCSLIFVGAPWLQEAMREIAPDIWSVRTLVARIEPQAVSETKASISEKQSFDIAEAEHSGDPVFALQEAEKLRGFLGKELALARLLHRAGEGFEARNDWRSAEKNYNEALKLKRQAGAPPESLLATLLELTWTCQMLAQVDRSVDYAQSALTLAHQIGNRSAEGSALGFLALAYADKGEMRKAIEFHEQALAISREEDDQHGEASILGNLGNVYVSLGDVRKAIELYEQQLDIVRKIGDQQGEGNALGSLGGAYLASGDARKAIEFDEQALMIKRKLGDKQTEGTILGNLAMTYFALGDVHKCIKLSEQRLMIAREIGDQRGEGNALGNLGIAYAKLGDERKAIEFYEKQLMISRAIGDKHGESKGLWNTAEALDKLGDREQAIMRAEAALKIFEAIEDPNAAKVRAKLVEWRASKT